MFTYQDIMDLILSKINCSFFSFRSICFYGWIRSYGRGRERGKIRDRIGLMAGLVKWLVVIVWQKVMICIPWVSCISSFTTVYRKNTIAYGFRISSCMVTDTYDRNTITCFMAKYGRIRSLYGMYAVLYDTVYRVSCCYTKNQNNSNWFYRFFL